MSKDQRRFYWSLWKKACLAKGWIGLPQDELTRLRHQAHYDAVGYELSSSIASNRELDKIFAEFKRLAGLASLDDGLQLAAQAASQAKPENTSFANDYEPLLDQIDPGQDRRLRFAILSKLKAIGKYIEYADRYLLQIVADKHHTDNLGKLSTKELWQLVYTLQARLASMTHQNQLAEAIDDNCPF